MNSDLSGYDNIKLFWLQYKSQSAGQLKTETEENTDLGGSCIYQLNILAGIQANFYLQHRRS